MCVVRSGYRLPAHGYARCVRVNPILSRIGSHSITAIQDRARHLRDTGRPLVDFSIGDPREPTAPFIPAALKEAVPAISQYPTVAGLPGLRQSIAGYVERRFGVVVDPETEVQPTTGSKESIFSTPLAFVDRDAGDGVIWPTPGYPIYERGGRLAGAVPLPVALSGDFVFRVDDVPAEAWEQARIVWLCSPHNPSGAVMPLDELTRFRERAARHDVLLCSDECYVDLYDGEPPHSMLQTGGTEGVIVYFSLSKRSGMTGYRSGAMVGDARAISALRALRTGTGTAPPEFTQAAAIAAWSDDGHVAERRELFRRKREILIKAFADLGYPTVASEAGLYVWLKVPDDVAMTERLLDEGVVVSPGRVFGPGGEGYIRLALVPTLDQCEQAVEVVANCLSNS
ncbi:MAG: aminotransferase class I/II-fold pyridoxal phosphate-dependent enzyme [bacterium]|nr:aminotransferase class I/II-fold pyridoxal phosphate-dependent enzyme [bacterium]